MTTTANSMNKGLFRYAVALFIMMLTIFSMWQCHAIWPIYGLLFIAPLFSRNDIFTTVCTHCQHEFLAYGDKYKPLKNIHILLALVLCLAIAGIVYLSHNGLFLLALLTLNSFSQNNTIPYTCPECHQEFPATPKFEKADRPVFPPV